MRIEFPAYVVALGASKQGERLLYRKLAQVHGDDDRPGELALFFSRTRAEQLMARFWNGGTIVACCDASSLLRVISQAKRDSKYTHVGMISNDESDDTIYSIGVEEIIERLRRLADAEGDWDQETG